MYLSRQQGHPASGFPTSTIAAGLAPPFCGEHTFRHAQEFVDDVVLVSDEDMCHSMKLLYGAGIVAEPSVRPLKPVCA